MLPAQNALRWSGPSVDHVWTARGPHVARPSRRRRITEGDTRNGGLDRAVRDWTLLLATKAGSEPLGHGAVLPNQGQAASPPPLGPQLA